MAVTVREYVSEGHRLLVTSAYSPSEIARLAQVARPRVSEWRAGRTTPAEKDRAVLEAAIGIPRRMWDAPPVAPPAPSAPTTAVVDASPAAAPASTVGAGADIPIATNLAGLGLDGLEALAHRLEQVVNQLPVRDRVRAMAEHARVLAVHEGLRQKAADARAEYLASTEFFADVRLLAAAIPGAAAALRATLARLGVDLPAPPATAAARADEAPTTPEDVEDLVRELEVAAEFRERSEALLAMSHTLALGLDTHAGAIATIAVDHPALATRLLELLDGPDERMIRGAIERRMAIRDASRLEPSARGVAAELARQLGHPDVAAELGAS